jgi:NAD(P)-dependent dehydrogenase (short-subunit alcohol dehydrogenase family)
VAPFDVPITQGASIAPLAFAFLVGYAVDVFFVFLEGVLQAFTKVKERKWGRIVFISSESALQIPTEMIHYGTTKTAQLAISRGLAEATIGTSVTVNALPRTAAERITGIHSQPRRRELR